MEYIVFRTLRMIEREISLYRDLYACMCNQQKMILQGDILDLLVAMVEQKELTSEIRMVEYDVMEELADLAVLFGMELPENKELRIRDVVHSLEEYYGELAEMIKTRCWVLTILLKKTKAQLDENLDSLRNCLELWRKQPSVIDLWHVMDKNFLTDDSLLLQKHEIFENQFVQETEYTTFRTG